MCNAVAVISLFCNHRIKFKNDVLAKTPSHVMQQYQSVMIITHIDLPIVISKENADRFKEKHGRDLLEEFQVNTWGVSRVACMCPKCPFFKKPLGQVAANAQISNELQEHINTFVPDFHKSLYKSKDDAEILASLLNKCLLIRVRETEVASALQSIKLIKTPIPWETFEAYFV